MHGFSNLECQIDSFATSESLVLPYLFETTPMPHQELITR